MAPSSAAGSSAGASSAAATVASAGVSALADFSAFAFGVLSAAARAGFSAGVAVVASPSSSAVTPRAASGVLGISRTLTLPPAASILARADPVNASATTNSGVDSSPAPRILSGLFRVRTSPTARRMSWLTVTGVLAEALPPSSSNAPASASAPIAPMFTTSYSTLNRFLKPRSFGMRMWSGVWPPSNQAGIPPPALAFWPFVPRPAVLPLPAAMPRPTRVRGWRDPSAGFRSCSFMTSPWRRCRRSPRRSRGTGPGGPCPGSPGCR